MAQGGGQVAARGDPRGRRGEGDEGQRGVALVRGQLRGRELSPAGTAPQLFEGPERVRPLGLQGGEVIVVGGRLRGERGQFGPAHCAGSPAREKGQAAAEEADVADLSV